MTALIGLRAPFEFGGREDEVVVEEEEGWRDGGGGRLVTRAKKARSDFRGGQGREPRRPMPRVGVVATIRVRGGIVVDVRGGDGFDIVRVVGSVVGDFGSKWHVKRSFWEKVHFEARDPRLYHCSDS